ncbi:melatonin receptor type 1B-B-like [Eublepharis macularius]|uniref:Melatonin receptor type 1B-B-like n=1 Tax=Eublepharis macularius TaxID=481883 RepID=A0AA97KFY7_EUBMA|nr:melatonin receptor type 1B-B-like [Eublepharis macularius]
MDGIRSLLPFFLLLKLAGALQLGRWNGSGDPIPKGWPGEQLGGPGGEGTPRAGRVPGERLLHPSQGPVSQAAGTGLPEGGAEEQVPPVESSPICPSKGGLWLGCGSRVVKSGLVCALGILIMLGNGAVIAVIASSVSGWSHSSRLVLLSLAAADAALAVLVVPLNLYHSLVLRPVAEEGTGGASSCRAVAFINSSVFGASLYSLAGVSLERYVAVFFPLRYGHLLTSRRVALFITAAWLLPALLLVPLTVPGPRAVLRVRFSAAALLCEPDYASNPPYSLMLAGTMFFPAAGTITFANLRLWLAARSQRRRGKGLAFRGSGAGPGRLRLLHVGPASRILGPVVLAFYVCWAPCMGTILYNAITRERVHEWLEFVALWLPTGSGFLNCFVYFWINRSFRHKFQKLGHQLCQLCCGAKQAQPGPSLPTLSVAVQRGCEQPGLCPDDSGSCSSSSLILSPGARAPL